MGNLKDFQELWESQPKYSLMKVILYAFSLLIIAFLLTVVVKAWEGEHVKILGFEINDSPKRDSSVKTSTPAILAPNTKDKYKLNSKSLIVHPPNNGIISSGNNAHNVAGTNNYVGVNGDVLTEPKLVDSEAEAVLKGLQKVKRQYKILGNVVLLYTNGGSNLNTYATQLRKYLEDHSYKIVGINPGGIESFEGIKIEPQNPDTPNINYMITVGSKLTPNGKFFIITK